MTNNELCHYGIRGQKWGERRFQNEDGSLKPAGRERYSSDRGLRSMQGRTGTATPIGQTSDGHNVYRFDKGTLTNQVAVAKIRRHKDVHNASGKTDREKINATKALVEDAKSGRVDKSNYASMDNNDFRVYIEEITGEDSDEYSDEDIAQMKEEFNRRLGITKKDQEKATNDKYDKLADEVIQGKYGNGEERKKKLGKDYEEIQKRVNKKLSHSFTYSDELYHFGIKGQKWGVRRFQNKDGTRTNLGKKRRSKNDRYRNISDADLRKSTDPKVIYANRDRLSDQELQARINRINMENNLSRISRGRSRSNEFVNKVLDKTVESASQEIAKEIGKGVAKAAMAALGGYAAAKLGGNATVQFAKWWLNTYKNL